LLRRINKFLSGFTLKKRARGRTGLRSSQGQVAIILILVTAFALIFYAVVLNLGRVAETETVTQIASNVGASLLASQMASYGQKLFKESMGGKKIICGWTGIIMAALVVVICIIILIVCLITQQWELTYFVWMAIAALAMAVVSLALQIVYIQPGISDMWNKIKSETMDTESAFVETGIQKALDSVVTDSVQVPDMHDLDTDTIWGYEEGDALKPKDKISRYAVYYNDRLQEIPKPDTKQFEAFVTGLREFLYFESDDWGLYDPVPTPDECSSADVHPCCDPDNSEDTTVLSECNPCCVPEEADRPDYCGTDNEAIMAKCLENSPYGTVNPINSSTYAYVYDAYLDDWTDTEQSFKELLGRDDEHRLYYKEGDLSVTAQIPHEDGEQGFRAGDTTGFQSDEDIYDSVDQKTGVFPFFNKILDWGVDLDKIDTADHPNECHWCDVGGGSACPGDQPLEIEQLDLSQAGVDLAELKYNTSYCVDGSGNNTSGNPPVAADKVAVLKGILAGEDTCAQNILENPDEDGFWKKGADRFCNLGDVEDQWPYYGNCAKQTKFVCENKSKEGKTYESDCTCEEIKKQDTDAIKDWPEDPLDDIVYGLPEFIEWAEYIVKQNRATMSQNIGLWYKTAAKWIEPKLPKGKTKKEARKDGDCYSCNEEDGTLIVWQNEIKEMKERLEAWRDTSYAGTTCTEVWCVPSSDSCEGVTSDEAATFDSNGNGIRGDLEDVAACLDWNVGLDDSSETDEVVYSGETGAFQECLDVCSDGDTSDDEAFCRTYTLGDTERYEECLSVCSDGDTSNDEDFCRLYKGNAGKFQACLDACSDEENDNDEEFCSEGKLSRSLVPEFDSMKFLKSRQADGDVDEFTQCYNSGPTAFDLGEVKTCAAACESLPSGDGRYDGVLKSWEAPTTHWEKESYACLVTCPSTCYRPCPPPLPPPPFCVEPYSCTALCPGTCWKDVEVLDDPGSCDDQSFFESVAKAMKKAQGSCSDDDAGGFLELLAQSLVEAKVQMVKFHHRLDFLSRRSAELNKAIDVLSDAEENFNVFLEGEPDKKNDSPAEQLIQLRLEQVDIEKDEGKTGVPLYAIYGWQDDPVKKEGYWHIVKVEGRIPFKCDNACGPSQLQSEGDPEDWPNVDEYTKSWGFKRCYELKDTDGVVKMRVIRWDQDRTDSSVRFPNGVKIWDFRYFNPKTDENEIPKIKTLVDDCESQSIGDPSNVPEEAKGIYAGAFMLNKKPDKKLSEARDAYNKCSRVAHQFLRHGVVSETCAMYYFHEGVSEGMGFKFVDCKEF